MTMGGRRQVSRSISWIGACLCPCVICVETLHRTEKPECEDAASYPVHGAPLGTGFSEQSRVRLGGVEQNFITGIEIGKGQGVRQYRDQKRQSEIEPYLPSGLPTSNQSDQGEKLIERRSFPEKCAWVDGLEVVSRCENRIWNVGAPTLRV